MKIKGGIYMHKDDSLQRLSDRSFVKHLVLNTELYKDEFNNILPDFPAYDVLIKCYESKTITTKQRETLTKAYIKLKEEHFKLRI